MNPLFQEIIWLLTCLDYRERWFVTWFIGSLWGFLHHPLLSQPKRQRGSSGGAFLLGLVAVERVSLCPCASPNREQGCQGGRRISSECSWQRFKSPSSLFSLNAVHDVCKNRLKWRLIPSLLLWCYSEVRRMAIKMNSPPLFLFPRKKKQKGGITNLWFVKQKKTQLLVWLLVCCHQMNIV